MRRALFLLAAVITWVTAPPRVAAAHVIGETIEGPIPVAILIVGLLLLLVAVQVLLTLLWSRPRLEGGPMYGSVGVRAPTKSILPVLGVVGLFLVIGQIIPWLFDLETDPRRPGIAPVLVWVVFWLVIPFGSVVVGNWYADLNPWRAIGSALHLGRVERSSLSDRVGLWPAAMVLLAFVWMELVVPGAVDPLALGLAALVYSLVLITAMARLGLETSLVTLDVFTSYNRLVSAISPLGRNEKGRVVWRGWLRALPVLPRWSGLWFFVAVMIGSVAFDGASGTSWFDAATGGLLDSRWGQSVLLVMWVLVVAGAMWVAAVVAGRLGDGGWPAQRTVQRFAHTLVPIGVAYAVSHYLDLIVFEGQQLIAAISDPFALGWDLLGTADRKIDYFVLSTEAIWYVQVASIVAGHIVAVVMAHDRALNDFGGNAIRSQYAMLVLMIGLSVLGLLVLT